MGTEGEFVYVPREDEMDWGYVKGSDFSLTLGAGLAMATGFGEVTLDGRYSWGLSNIMENSPYFETKNRGYLIMAGVGF